MTLDYPSGGLKVITGSLGREAGASGRGDETEKQRLESLKATSQGQWHLYELEKAKEQILPWSSQEEPAL